MKDADKLQRGKECAKFISSFMDKLDQEIGLSDCWNWPVERWEDILLAHGVDSYMHLFWDPERFEDAKNPFEYIDPIYTPLEALHSVLTHPEFDILEIRTKVMNIEQHKRELIEQFPVVDRQVMIPVNSPAIKQLRKFNNELMQAKASLVMSGVAYSLTWHWINTELGNFVATAEQVAQFPKDQNQHPSNGAGLTKEQVAFIQGASLKASNADIIQGFTERFGFEISLRTVQRHRSKANG